MASSPGSSPGRGGDRAHLAEVGAGGDGSVSVAVVEAVADARGVDPAEVDFRLDDHVDADALDALYRHARRREAASWRLDFHVDGTAVTVRSDGTIAVD